MSISPEEITMVLITLNYGGRQDDTYAISLSAPSPEVSSAYENPLWWLEGPNTVLDVNRDCIKDYPILECLILPHGRWDIVQKMVESMYALDADCGHYTTDFMKSFLALYPLLRYGHSDYQRSVDEVGEKFVHKVPVHRRAEIMEHVTSVLEAMKDSYSSEFVGGDEWRLDYIERYTRLDLYNGPGGQLN